MKAGPKFLQASWGIEDLVNCFSLLLCLSVLSHLLSIYRNPSTNFGLLLTPFPLWFISCRIFKSVISMWLGEKGHVVTEIHPSSVPIRFPNSHTSNCGTLSLSLLLSYFTWLTCWIVFSDIFLTLRSILILTSFKKWNSQPIFFQSVIVLSPELVWYHSFILIWHL